MLLIQGKENAIVSMLSFKTKAVDENKKWFIKITVIQ